MSDRLTYQDAVTRRKTMDVLAQFGETTDAQYLYISPHTTAYVSLIPFSCCAVLVCKCECVHVRVSWVAVLLTLKPP